MTNPAHARHVVHRFVQRILAVLTGASMAFVFLVVLGNSLSRYLFGSTFIWAQGAAVYGMIYGTVFGVLLAYLQGLNVRFALVTDALPKRAAPYLNALTHLATIAVGVTFTVSAIAFVEARGGIRASGMDLSMAYMQTSMVVLGIGLVLVALLKLFEPGVARTEAERVEAARGAADQES